MEKCREKVETAAQQTELLSEEAVEQMSNQELLFLYRESGDEELKWKLVLRMTGMVRAIAAQVWGIYSSFAQLDDIVEEGILVLLSAVDKFDPSKDVKFETYVSKRLRGMIVDLARHQDWLAASSAAEVYPSEPGQRGAVHADGAHAQQRGNGGPSGRDKRGIWGYAL